MTFFANVRRPEPSPEIQFTPQQLIQRIEAQVMHQLRVTNQVAASMAQRVIIDPGADISPEDANLWLTLLSRTESTDRELYARLFYLRGAGTRLISHPQWGYVFTPIVDATGKRGWPSQQFYQQEIQCLEPYREQVVTMLKTLEAGTQQQNLWSAAGGGLHG